MVTQYANQQPQGFKNKIENVAIVGAGGQCGKHIVDAILKAGKHKITAITREGSTSKIPEGVQVKPVNYEQSSTLVEALRGQDALIITMSITAPDGQSTKLIEAAAAANVPWILPNDWGCDFAAEGVGRDIIIGPKKEQEHHHIESLGKSTYTGVACGFWYEYSLARGVDYVGFDFKNKTVLFFDDGNTRISMSSWPQTGRAAAQLLGLKLLPDDENDKSPTLAEFRNRLSYVASFTINQKEMFESVLRVTGDKESDWKVSYEPVKDVYAKGMERLKAGDTDGFPQLLYARMFFPDKNNPNLGCGNTEELRGLDNEKLGLSKEELDDYTKVGVRLAETGF